MASPDRLIGSADPGGPLGGHKKLKLQLEDLRGCRGNVRLPSYGEFRVMVDSFDVVPKCGRVRFVMFGQLVPAGTSAWWCPYV